MNKEEKTPPLDRSVEPAFKEIESIAIAEAEVGSLDNHVQMYSINAGEEEVVKMEFLFDAGSFDAPSPLVSRACNNLINEGTATKSSAQIADELDFYGAHLELNSDSHNSSVTLYVINKYLEQTLPLVEDIIKHSVFPQKELDTYLQNAQQEFAVNSEKVQFLARNHFSEILFGKHHPYGYVTQIEDYEKIERKEVVDFYHAHYGAEKCRIIVSGKIKPSLKAMLNNYFGQNEWLIKTAITNGEPKRIETAKTKQHFIKKPKAVQSAIRIGRLMLKKTHPDYMGMQVLNTVFGGYFNSRLMANIREDKGYTYGIGSGMVPMQGTGYFFVATEVSTEVCQKTIDEIYYELKHIREELIPKEELEVAKNYLLGNFLRSIDGPFALANMLKGVMLYDLNYDYYQQYIDTIKNITSEELNQLAKKYFQQEDMYQVVVGEE